MELHAGLIRDLTQEAWADRVCGYRLSQSEGSLMKPVYLGDFSSKEDVIVDFSGNRWSDDDKKKDQEVEDSLKDSEILLAWYGGETYEGQAFVLFRKDGKLWEVNGGHCSCYGLEGQWEPEETTLEALDQRVIEGIDQDYYAYQKECDEALKEIIKQLREEAKVGI